MTSTAPMHRCCALIVIGLSIAALTGCGGWIKTTVPFSPAYAPSAPAPVIQGLLAAAADDVLKKAPRDALAVVNGKRVCVDVTGVMESDDRLLFRYLRSSTEQLLGRSGGIVVPCCRQPVVGESNTQISLPAPTEGDGEEATVRTPSLHRSCTDLDYRAVVNVSHGGIDFTSEQKFSGGKFAARFVLAVGAPLALMATGAGLASDTDGFSLAVTAPIATSSMIAGIIWWVVSPTYEKFTHLDAKVRASVALIPQRARLKYSGFSGEGLKRLTIEPRQDHPLLLDYRP